MLAFVAMLQPLQALACPACDPIWPATPLGTAWLCGATLAVCLMETFTTQIDNLVVPLYFYSLLQLAASATR